MVLSHEIESVKANEQRGLGLQMNVVSRKRWQRVCKSCKTNAFRKVFTYFTQTSVKVIPDANLINHIVCIKMDFWGTLSFPMLMETSTHMIYTHICIRTGRYIFLIGSPTWWRFSFYSSGSFLVCWWHDAPLVHELQMWGHRCKQWDSYGFEGHKMRFCGIWSTMLR